MILGLEEVSGPWPTERPRTPGETLSLSLLSHRIGRRALEETALRVSDPASGDYGRYLTQEAPGKPGPVSFVELGTHSEHS